MAIDHWAVYLLPVLRDRVISAILGILVLAALGAIVYVVGYHPPEESFTEFYILGPDGKAVGYPSELVSGREESVTLNIANHENETVSYLVEVQIGGVKANNEVGPIVLKNGDRWEGEVVFTLQVIGTGQRVDFLLFKNEAAEPSNESLHLWINVTD